MFDFKRRVLLVTGAGGGIGSATAAYFHACGARVMIGDINEAAAANVAQSLDPTGKRVRALHRAMGAASQRRSRSAQHDRDILQSKFRQAQRWQPEDACVRHVA